MKFTVIGVKKLLNHCEKENLDIKFLSPVTDHESSDNCGVEILGARREKFLER